jgi:peptidoglycan/LPS O-acetylase OafA/YrhL
VTGTVTETDATTTITTTTAAEPSEAPVITPGPEAPAPRRPPRFPAFDGLRAIAAITVVVVHVSFVGGLTSRNPAIGIYTARTEIGVSVFFLISGFLLYRPFVVAHLAGAPKPRTGAFWLRRLLRIIPAYWLVLFVATSIFHAGPGIGPGGWRAYASHYLFAQIYSPFQDLKGISAAWSLCVEMTFYLYIPLYAAFIGRRRSRRTISRTMHVELIGLATMIAISYAWRYIVLRYQHGHSAYFHLATIWLPAFLDLFALGMGLAAVSAWMHHHGQEVKWMWSRWFPWVSWVCAGVCFWAVSHIGTPIVPIYHESELDLARQTLYAAFAFFLLLPAVFGPQGKGLIRRFLQCWPVASLGVISYGIYLWHETWIYQILKVGHYRLFTLEFWAFFLCVLALAIMSAGLSYFVLEKPVLKLKSSITWWGRSPKAPDAPLPPAAEPLAVAVTGPLDQRIGGQEEQRDPYQRVGDPEVPRPRDVGNELRSALAHGHIPGGGDQETDGARHYGHPDPGDSQFEEDDRGDEEAEQRRHEQSRRQTAGEREDSGGAPGRGSPTAPKGGDELGS